MLLENVSVLGILTLRRGLIAAPPGETIKEQFELRKMTQKDFDARMGLSEQHIIDLIQGTAYLTHDVAHRLEMVLGLPAESFLTMIYTYNSLIYAYLRTIH